MQLPGMSYDPVRVVLECTWWPDDHSFGVARKLWTRPHRGDTWVLEDMATSGSPISVLALPDRWASISEVTLRYFMELVNTQGDPF